MIHSSLLAYFLLTGGLVAQVVWEKPVQEFHCQASERVATAQFSFRNSGSAVVSIKRLTSSCGCTAAVTEKKVYNPGESGQVKATFTFGGLRGFQRKQVTVEFSDGTAQTLQLNVTIDDLLSVTPSLLYWKMGEAPIPKTVQLKVTSVNPLGIRSVESGSPAIKADLSVVKAGETYLITVTPKDTAERVSSSIAIRTDFPAEAPKSYTVYVRIK